MQTSHLNERVQRRVQKPTVKSHFDDQFESRVKKRASERASPSVVWSVKCRLIQIHTLDYCSRCWLLATWPLLPLASLARLSLADGELRIGMNLRSSAVFVLVLVVVVVGLLLILIDQESRCRDQQDNKQTRTTYVISVHSYYSFAARWLVDYYYYYRVAMRVNTLASKQAGQSPFDVT